MAALEQWGSLLGAPGVVQFKDIETAMPNRILASILAFLVLLAASAVGVAAPIISGNYYEEQINPTCPSSFYFCRANFSATPADKILFVERVSCFVVTTQPIIESMFAFSTTLNGSSARPFPLAFAKTVQSENLHYYNVNEEVKIRVGPGRYPFIYLQYPDIGSANLKCVIVGTLQQLP